MLQQVSRLSLAGLAAALAFAAGACSNEADLPELPTAPAQPPSPLPESEFTVEEQAAVDGALEVFDLYLATFVRLASEGAEAPGGDHYEELHQYGSALHIPYEGIGLDNNLTRGWLGSGTVEWELLEVVEVDLADGDNGVEFPTVTFQACLDETSWTLVDADSGEVMEGPGEREVVAVTARFTSGVFGQLRAEEAWRVSGWDYEEGQAC